MMSTIESSVDFVPFVGRQAQIGVSTIPGNSFNIVLNLVGQVVFRFFVLRPQTYSQCIKGTLIILL